MLGYSDPSIQIRTPLLINTQSPVDTFTGALNAASLPLSEQEVRAFYATETGLFNPKRFITEKALPGFSPTSWAIFSTTEYKKSKDYPSVSGPSLSLSIYRILMDVAHTTLKQPVLNFGLIGDYSEVSPLVQTIIKPLAQYPDLIVDWTALVPDPYELKDSNLKAVKDLDKIDSTPEKLKISTIHQVYDSYIGSKWFSGPDGTGLLNHHNIIWLAERNPKQNITIGSLVRPNYLTDDLDSITLYYRLCLATISLTAQGGIAFLKIVLPTSAAHLGLYGLFSIFFQGVTMFRFNQYSPDDDTVWLLGTNCTPIPPSFLKLALSTPEVKDRILNYLSKNTNPIHLEIERAFLKRPLNWINNVAGLWNQRNN